MKVRSIKRRFFHLFAGRAEAAKTVTAKVLTKTMYPVLRKKDSVQVDLVASIEAAQALIDKAKAAKKASLIVGEPVQVAA